ncbi:MAG TPA: phage tail protein, partial [Candidatus Dormibacteraeota bacterium]
MIAAPPVSERKRGLVNSLASPHPLGQYLPGLYQEDDFAQRFLSAFDSALAPIFVTLDNLNAYMDPWLAPEDFLDWLGSWFGLTLDESWSVQRRRTLVANAFEFYRMRGTSRGLK